MAHVMVIDDEDYVRTLLRIALETEGHVVSDACGGLQGLQAQRECPAEVVFCDLLMPGLDGLHVIHTLRCEFPTIGVIAVSGGGSDFQIDLFEVAMLLGANAALPKPFSLPDVLSAAEKFLATTTRQ